MQKTRKRSTRTKRHTTRASRTSVPARNKLEPAKGVAKSAPRQYPINPAPPILRLTAFLIDASVIYVLIVVSKFLAVIFSVEEFVWHPEAATQDILILVGYFVIPTAFWGRTFGKWAAGIVIVDSSGYLPGPVLAIPREMAFKFIAAALLLVGIAWLAIDPKRQGMHDKLANTYVVYNPDSRLASMIMSIAGVSEKSEMRSNSPKVK